MALTKEEYEAAFNEGYEEATAWKSIDTAPREPLDKTNYGPPLLLWVEDVVGFGYWDADFNKFYVAYPDGAPPPQPTHWQPLPPAPTAGQE